MAPSAPIDRETYEVDMNGPLISQVQYLTKQRYLKWVHTPEYLKDEHGKPRIARFFKSGFLEVFSRTPWYVVPTVWLPFAYWLFNPAIQENATYGASLVVFGILLWTLVEYTLHRFVFHFDERIPDHPVCNTIHFLIHGVHHKIPMDRYRLVMPPLLALPFAILVWTTMRTICFAMTLNNFRALFGGLTIGYICYDLMHYYTHHGNIDRRSYFGIMKSYHMKHHFHDMYDKGFGITSKFWDWVFGTLLDVDEHKRAAAAKRAARAAKAGKGE